MAPEETDQDHENVGDSPEPEGRNTRRNESKKLSKTNSPPTPPKQMRKKYW
jgi:hypothetical protein